MDFLNWGDISQSPASIEATNTKKRQNNTTRRGARTSSVNFIKNKTYPISPDLNISRLISFELKARVVRL